MSTLESTAKEAEALSDPLEEHAAAADSTITSTTATQAAAPLLPSSAPTVSKNQLKRQRRYERAMQVKKQKKLQEKQAKQAKALAQGLDLETERRLQQERFKQGRASKHRQERWDQQSLPHAINHSFQVCIDCSFEKDMTTKEINSLASQIRYCYSMNKNSTHPCLLAVTSLGGGTMTRTILEKVSGFQDWQQRGFTCTEQSLLEYYTSNQQQQTPQRNHPNNDKTISNIVYLTSDSDNVIQQLENDKIYVIGGIVDRNRLKRAAMTRAANLGVATARLPLDEHIQEMPSTRVLTCNHVFALLLKYKECNKNWKQAFMQILPQRKGAQVATVEPMAQGEAVGNNHDEPTTVEGKLHQDCERHRYQQDEDHS